MSNDLIYSICEDANGNLWIGTADGLNVFNRNLEIFNRVKLPKTKLNVFGSNQIFKVFANHKSDHVLVSSAVGLFKFNTNTGSAESVFISENISNLYYEKVIALFEDLNGNIWAGTDNSNVFRINENGAIKLFKIEFKYNNEDLDKIVTKIDKDFDDNIICSTNLGICIIDSKTDEMRVFQISRADNGIKDFVKDKSERYFVATSGAGVFVLNRNFELVHRILQDVNNSNSIKTNVISSVFIDKLNTIWIGTNGDGIDYYNPYVKKFNAFGKGINDFTLNSIRTFYTDSENKLFVGGYKGVAIKADNQDLFTSKHNEYLVNYNNIILNNNFYVFHKYSADPNKYLWVGTEGGGLLKLNIEDYSLKIFPSGKTKIEGNLFGNIIHCLLEDGNKLWVGTEKGLNVFDIKSEKVVKYYVNDWQDRKSIGKSSVICVYKDKSGKIWVGTDFGGLNLFNESDESFTKYSYLENDSTSLPSNFVKCIFEDKHGNLWIGTMGGGLSKFNREKNNFKNYSEKNGLPNNVVYGILEDKNGNLWMSTNLGISKFNPVSEKFRNFNYQDGLPGNEFNTNAYYKSDKGEMFFGGTNGFTRFFPEDIQDNPIAAELSLINFYLFSEKVKIGKEYGGNIILEKSITETDEIELSYFQNYIKLEFASLDLASAKNINYEYKLEGFSDDWINSGKDRIATYTNLDPGDYKFIVRTINESNSESTKSKLIKIKIVPPFWKTWWFKIFAAFLFSSVILLGVRQKLTSIRKRNLELEKIVEKRTSELTAANEKLKESNETKNKFFSIIAHDIRGSLFGIVGYSEILYSDFDSIPVEEKGEIVNNLYISSQKLQQLIDNLLNWARLQTGKIQYTPSKNYLNEIINSTFELFESGFANKKIKPIRNIVGDIYVEADTNMLKSILVNFVNNAIKFSNPGGTISISAKPSGDVAEICIKDNGIGMSQNLLDKLFLLDAATTRAGTHKETGTGLGIKYCKELIDKHGQKIWFESKEGHGTSVFFTLKLSTKE